MLRHGYQLSIKVDSPDDQGPWIYHGEYLREDETFIKIRGTVGDNIGKEILVPKSRIKDITILRRERESDEPFGRGRVEW
jgi:hypothetical protein